MDTFDDYLRGHPLFGSVVGRYANRIAGAKVTIDGVEYPLTPNAGKIHIHGGRNGFQKKVWQAAPLPQDGAAAVELTLTSPDGDEGYPGTLHVKLVYSLTDDNELKMDYTATTDKPTIVNLTNHTYWNLAGAGSGDILGHILTLYADAYLPANDQKLPTGEIRSVKGTVMDFTEPHPMGARIKQVDWENYDHCYVLNKRPGESLSHCRPRRGPEERPSDGRVDHQARRPVLHGPHPEQPSLASGRTTVCSVRRLLPGNAAFPRRAEPAQLSVPGAAPGPDVSPPHRAQVQRAEVIGLAGIAAFSLITFCNSAFLGLLSM